MKQKTKIEAKIVILNYANYEEIYREMLKEYFNKDNLKGAEYWIFLDNNKYLIGIADIFQLIQCTVDYAGLIFWIKKESIELISDEIIQNNDLIFSKKWEVEVFLEEKCESENTIRKNYEQLSFLFNKVGINQVKVSIPSLKSLRERNTAHKGEGRLLFISLESFFSEMAKYYIDKYVEKISPVPYLEMKHINMIERDMDWHDYIKSERNDWRIFIIGPCIACGGVNLKRDTLAAMLKRKLESLDINMQIICIETMRNDSSSMNRIFQYDLTNHDMVFMIEEEGFLGVLSESDLNLKSLYKNYEDKWLYYDIPVHATVFGQDLIIDKMLEKLLTIYKEKEDVKHVLLHTNITATNINNLIYNKLYEYINKIKNEINIIESGAIVMNANPFTNGHRYLVEYALEHVKHLIIFVVEEDDSYIPFKARLELVKKGTEDLPDVVVVPSGDFIISKTTFKGYFEKEVQKEAQIDAAVDIEIFGKYIAKELNITKRFVGEEPNDFVTFQYNEQMKKQLINYGIELIEIPRKLQDDKRNVISAGSVRRLLQKNCFKVIEKMVPEHTFFYIKENKAFLEKRRLCRMMIKDEIERKNINYLSKIQNMEEILNYISINKNLILYGMGIDALLIIQELSEKIWKKMVLCDKKALNKTYYILQKKVISPDMILKEYRNYNIIIASRKYGEEIFRELMLKGIDPARMLWAV